MKRTGFFKAGMLALACSGMLLPPPVLHAAVADQAPGQRVAVPASTAVDVELHPGGVLLGQVLDAGGNPSPGIPVSLHLLGREVATTVTDQSGCFRVSGLRGGTLEIVAGPHRGVFRIWAPNTAPPSMLASKSVVLGGQQVRGQCDTGGPCDSGGPIGYWLCNPWIIAGLVAAAVAIPVAIHNNRIHRDASP